MFKQLYLVLDGERFHRRALTEGATAAGWESVAVLFLLHQLSAPFASLIGSCWVHLMLQNQKEVRVGASGQSDAPHNRYFMCLMCLMYFDTSTLDPLSTSGPKGYKRHVDGTSWSHPLKINAGTTIPIMWWYTQKVLCTKPQRAMLTLKIGTRHKVHLLTLYRAQNSLEAARWIRVRTVRPCFL